MGIHFVASMRFAQKMGSEDDSLYIFIWAKGSQLNAMLLMCQILFALSMTQPHQLD